MQETQDHQPNTLCRITLVLIVLGFIALGLGWHYAHLQVPAGEPTPTPDHRAQHHSTPAPPRQI